MRSETQKTVVSAINSALFGWVEARVGDMLRAQDRLDDFIEDLNIVVGIHDNLVAQLEPDKELEDAIQGRDRANWAQNVNAPHEAKALWEGGWEGVPQHGGD